MGYTNEELAALQANLTRPRPSTHTPPPPPKPPTLPTEAEEMIMLCQWMSLVFARYEWFHCPNERANKTERCQLSAAGVMPGVPDLIILREPRAVLELKRADRVSSSDPEAGASDAQRAWLASFRAKGWQARVCYGARDASQWLASLYGFRALW
jgi:hypothetical protein